jgi:hypothetical protein
LFESEGTAEYVTTNPTNLVVATLVASLPGND